MRMSCRRSGSCYAIPEKYDIVNVRKNGPVPVSSCSYRKYTINIQVSGTKCLIKEYHQKNEIRENEIKKNEIMIGETIRYEYINC